MLALELDGTKLCPDTCQLMCEPVGPITLLLKRLLVPDPLGLNCRDAELDGVLRAALRKSDKACQEESRGNGGPRKVPAERSVLSDRAENTAQRDNRFTRNCL
ncbi:hypothetical protein [Bradyrhizobium sp. WSM3983]|uniref:hypothetical protein n=1 Tax=Bradyrhizobium sp. WSM3983 TaxID=1038867 RepID=UPI0012EBAECD|nr:hypothetical protein [Bradyrhizobium sp. WSM3983]